MGWIYDSRELKSKQDYENQLKEIQAYAQLDGQDFDFGSGLIINEMSYGSEDAYYEMDIDNLVDAIGYWDENEPVEASKKRQIRGIAYRRYCNEREERHLKYLTFVSWMNVFDNGDWLQRCYRGRRSVHLKKRSNRKIRKYKEKLPVKGNTHRKIFDYWWELY